jgi:hypothetical protein
MLRVPPTCRVRGPRQALSRCFVGDSISGWLEFATRASHGARPYLTDGIGDIILAVISGGAAEYFSSKKARRKFPLWISDSPGLMQSCQCMARDRGGSPNRFDRQRHQTGQVLHKMCGENIDVLLRCLMSGVPSRHFLESSSSPVRHERGSDRSPRLTGRREVAHLSLARTTYRTQISSPVPARRA